MRAAMSSMPQFEPHRAIVSYSGPSPSTSLMRWKLRQASVHW